jgi:hypothetical protein
MALHKSRSAGSATMRSSVAPVSALMGLKQTLPQSLSQIFQRTSSRTGASKPAPTSASLNACVRAERLRSGSPRMNRFKAW